MSDGLLLEVDAELVLRSPAEEDAEMLFRLVDRNRGYLRQWLPWLDANLEPAHTREFIGHSREQQEQGRSLVLLIEYLGRLCGVAGYNTVDRANRIGELGYWLDERHQGKGIVTRACRALVEYGFETLGLNRVTLAAAVENRKSRAVAERLGFRQEGVRRDAEWLYDHYVDHAAYALLHQDLRPEPCRANQPRR